MFPLFALLRIVPLTQYPRGFAAKASASVIENVSALSSAYNPFIEEDQIVSINGEDSA